MDPQTAPGGREEGACLRQNVLSQTGAFEEFPRPPGPPRPPSSTISDPLPSRQCPNPTPVLGNGNGNETSGAQRWAEGREASLETAEMHAVPTAYKSWLRKD